MIADIVNGSFEVLGGFFVGLHCTSLLRDKQVRGADWRAAAFFWVWGTWNLFYYPHLEQWWSLFGSMFVTVMNSLWLFLMIYYIRKERVAFAAHRAIHGTATRERDLAERCQAYSRLSK